MARPKKDKRSPEEIDTENRNFKIKETRDNFISQPTRYFKVGEKVRFGGHDNTEIKEVFDNGNFYEVRCFGKKQHYHEMINYDETYFVLWAELFKHNTNENQTQFSKKYDILGLGNIMLQGLIWKTYRPGVDFEVDYQRGYVWNLEDKQALIESIFECVDIGKFVFLYRNYVEGIHRPSYEIIDGKQRLSTLKEYYEDRFEYKGKKFSDLSPHDRSHICYYNCSYADIDEGKKTKKDILNLFYRLNRHGKIMNKEHLEKVKNMIEEEERNGKINS